MKKHNWRVYGYWPLLKQLIFIFALTSCVSALSGTGGNTSRQSESAVVDVASSWMAQTAFEDGDLVQTLKLAYSWHREQPDSWMSIDFIGDVYFCLNEFAAARINYQLASMLAKASNDSVKIIETKIQAIDGNEKSVQLIGKILKCPKSVQTLPDQDP